MSDASVPQKSPAPYVEDDRKQYGEPELADGPRRTKEPEHSNTPSLLTGLVRDCPDLDTRDAQIVPRETKAV